MKSRLERPGQVDECKDAEDRFSICVRYQLGFYSLGPKDTAQIELLSDSDAEGQRFFDKLREVVQQLPARHTLYNPVGLSGIQEMSWRESPRLSRAASDQLQSSPSTQNEHEKLSAQ